MLSIAIVLLAGLLGVLLWINKKDEDKKAAELDALNIKLYQEEQEKAAALKQKEAEDNSAGYSREICSFII